MRTIDDMGGPTSHSERLKVEYARVMQALYRDMTQFATPGVESGVAEVAELLERNEHAMRHQFGPTSYDHAPTVHAFLQVIETLKSQATVNEIARLADCVAIPRAPGAAAVRAPAGDDLAFAALQDRAAAVVVDYRDAMVRTPTDRPLSQRHRTEVRERLYNLIAYAAHLLTRLE
ncbi:MAG TPA: hypothetical protein PLN31_17330 [Azoarcus taiwanensis]|nr:hypothetical protein [Azoarcus taiwanensis]